MLVKIDRDNLNLCIYSLRGSWRRQLSSRLPHNMEKYAWGTVAPEDPIVRSLIIVTEYMLKPEAIKPVIQLLQLLATCCHQLIIAHEVLGNLINNKS